MLEKRHMKMQKEVWHKTREKFFFSQLIIRELWWRDRSYTNKFVFFPSLLVAGSLED
jgi:hypothetical protein